MKDSNELKFIRNVMLNINIIWMLFYVIFVYITINRICDGYLAYKFLSQSDSLSLPPLIGLYLGIFFTVGLLLLFMMGETFKSQSASVVMLIVRIFFLHRYSICYKWFLCKFILDFVG